MSMTYLILSYVFGLMIVKKMCLSNLKFLFDFLNVWLDINNVYNDERDLFNSCIYLKKVLQIRKKYKNRLCD